MQIESFNNTNRGYAIIASFAFFAYVMNPSLKFIYKSALINLVPFFICLLLLFIQVLKRKVKLTLNSMLAIIYLCFFFSLQYVYFLNSELPFETLLRVISVNFAFIFGIVLGQSFEKRYCVIFMTIWALLLSCANLLGVINYSDGIEFNHLNFTLPLATVVTWYLFKSFTVNSGRNVLRLLLILFIFYNVLFAGSRTAIFLPILLCAIIMVVFRKYISAKKVILLLSVFGVIIVLSLPLIINNLSGYFISKMQGMEQISNDSRYDLYSHCIKIILDNPFGIGYGNYKYFISEPYPHNILLEIALNSGLIGCLLFLFYIIYILSVAINKCKRNYCEFSLFAIILFCYSFMSWMISNDFASSSVVFFLLGVVSYNALTTDKKEIIGNVYCRNNH
ncbi:TPA: O-antigen ligase family protein [Enterobacter hormaechei]